jgi:hypothetical protein
MLHLVRAGRFELWSFATIAAVLSFGLAGAASAVNPLPAGLDVFATEQPTLFNIPGVGYTPFEGNPAGLGFSCNADMGNADTIIQRLGDAFAPVDSIPIEIIALSLQSVAPVDIGNGPETLFVTLNQDLGGGIATLSGMPADSGLMNSQLNFAFDLTGSTTGFIATEIVTLAGTAQPWAYGGGGNRVSEACGYLFYTGSPWTEVHIADNEEKHSVTDALLTTDPPGGPGLGYMGLIALGGILMLTTGWLAWRRSAAAGTA